MVTHFIKIDIVTQKACLQIDTPPRPPPQDIYVYNIGMFLKELKYQAYIFLIEYILPFEIFYG